MDRRHLRINNVQISFHLSSLTGEETVKSETRGYRESASALVCIARAQHQFESGGGEIKSLKQFGNFSVVRDLSGLVFTLFRSGHVNLTGIPCFCRVDKALARFCLLFGFAKGSLRRNHIGINNSTASANLSPHSSLDLFRLRQIVNAQKNKSHFFHLRPHFFPGAVYRNLAKRSNDSKSKRAASKNRNGEPTAILFRSGKVNFVGARSASPILRTYARLQKWTRQMETAQTTPTQSAVAS